MKNMKKYQCTACEYLYNPEIGDSDNDIEPGTSFYDLPPTWVCPDCGEPTGSFEPTEE